MQGGYFLSAGVLYKIAKDAYASTHSAESETERDQDGAITALLFSAATLEAFIMELALHAESGSQMCPEPSPVHNLAPILNEAESSHGSVRLKFHLVKSVLTGSTYDKGAQPFQDFDLLFRIRDAIIHMKPERILENPHRIVAALSSRGLCEEEQPNMKASWLHHISTRSVARWACNVVADMVNSIRGAFPADSDATINPYMMMAFGSNHFPHID